MFVLSFFCHVDIHLVAYEEFMTAIAYADGRCVHLVAVSDVEPMETASYECCDGIGGTVSHAQVHASVLMLVLQTCRDVSTIAHPVGAH